MAYHRQALVTRDGVQLRRCHVCHAWKPKTPQVFPIRYYGLHNQPVLYAFCRDCNREQARAGMRAYRGRQKEVAV